MVCEQELGVVSDITLLKSSYQTLKVSLCSTLCLYILTSGSWLCLVWQSLVADSSFWDGSDELPGSPPFQLIVILFVPLTYISSLHCCLLGVGLALETAALLIQHGVASDGVISPRPMHAPADAAPLPSSVA